MQLCNPKIQPVSLGCSSSNARTARRASHIIPRATSPNASPPSTYCYSYWYSYEHTPVANLNLLPIPSVTCITNPTSLYSKPPKARTDLYITLHTQNPLRPPTFSSQPYLPPISSSNLAVILQPTFGTAIGAIVAAAAFRILGHSASHGVAPILHNQAARCWSVDYSQSLCFGVSLKVRGYRRRFYAEALHEEPW